MKYEVIKELERRFNKFSDEIYLMYLNKAYSDKDVNTADLEHLKNEFDSIAYDVLCHFVKTMK